MLMLRLKSSSFIILSIGLTLLIGAKAYARRLSDTENQKYGQQNILFYVPCDSDVDCNNPYADYDDIDPGDPSDPSDPSIPSDPGDPSTPGDPGDPMTPSGSGADLIVSTARAMSWPTTAGTCRNRSGSYVSWQPALSSLDGKPCLDTMSDYLKSLGYTNLVQDCGKFVGIVMRNSVDSSFQASGVKYQIPYMNRSNKWTKVSTDGQVFSWGNLHPGDVLALSDSGHGHILIWLGNQSVPCGGSTCQINVASSSFHKRSPSLNKISRLQMCLASETFGNGERCMPYKVYRWTGE